MFRHILLDTELHCKGQADTKRYQDGHNKGTKTPIRAVIFNYWPKTKTHILLNTLHINNMIQL